MSTSAGQRLDGYDPFATIYSSTIAEDFCRRVLPIVHKLLLQQLPPGARILDLCCGSGQMARELTAEGFRVVGLDVSEQMIEHARQIAPRAFFFMADARNLYLEPNFDAVLSSFNSLAHASSLRELQQIFANVRAALKPSAPMLFDLSMEEAYTSKWRGSFGGAQDELEWTVRPSYDPTTRRARNDVSLFRRQGTSWHRHDFAIPQTCHSESEIQTALRRSGFHDVSCYDAERDLQMRHESGRLFFLCR
jgi:SAM-dependent methyltransferase